MHRPPTLLPANPPISLNDAQKRSILLGCLDLYRRLADMEALLAQGQSSSPFSQDVNDVAPAEAHRIRDGFGRLRDRMLAGLAEAGITLEVRRTGVRWGVQCGLSFLRAAVAEMGPERLRGYGPLEPAGAAIAERLRQELDWPIDSIAAMGLLEPGAPVDQKREHESSAAMGFAGSAARADDDPYTRFSCIGVFFIRRPTATCCWPNCGMPEGSAGRGGRR